MKQFFSPLMICVYLFVTVIACSGSRPLPKKNVLFDEGHGQKFLINDAGLLGLSGLAAVFSRHDFSLSTRSAPLDHQALTDIDILIISGPFAPYSPGEISAIQKFLSEGGHLCLMLHIAPPLHGLLQQIGINPARGVVYENENVLQDNPLDFRADSLAPHPLTQNLQHVNFYGAWGFMSPLENQEVIARTSPHAWIDLNRNGRVEPQLELYPYGLIITGKRGKGNFVVFSDDAIFQNKFLHNENSVLAENLAQWLAQ